MQEVPSVKVHNMVKHIFKIEKEQPSLGKIEKMNWKSKQSILEDGRRQSLVESGVGVLEEKTRVSVEVERLIPPEAVVAHAAALQVVHDYRRDAQLLCYFSDVIVT